MPPITRFTEDDDIPEASDSEYECYFEDAAGTGAGLPGSAILTIKLWLSDVTSDTTIHDRADQNVLNTNGGVLSIDGKFVQRLGALDNVFVGTVPKAGLQEHRMVFRVTYTLPGGGGTGQLVHEVRFFVRNLAHTT